MINELQELNIELIDTVPCPICLINIDDTFTIVHANKKFYEMINYSEKEIKFKFKNALSALMDIDVLHIFSDNFFNHETSFFTLEHTLHKQQGMPIWVYSLVAKIEGTNMAYLVCTNIESYKNDSLKLEDMKSKIAYIYKHLNFDVFEYNVEADSIIIEYSNLFFPRSMPLDISMQDFINQKIIHVDNIKEFQRAITKIKNDEQEISLEIKIKDKNEQYHYAKLSLGKLKHNDKIMIIGVLIDIASEKEATSKYLNETRFYQAILSHQDAYGHLDATIDKINRVGGLWSLYNEIIDKISFTELFAEFIDKVVYPEDRDHYHEVMNCTNFISSFNGGITYLECEFRRITEQNKMEWMKLTVHLFKDTSNNHIMALLYLKDINDQKRKELSYTYDINNTLYKNVYDKISLEHMITNYLKFMNKSALCAFAVVSFFKKNKGILSKTEFKRIIDVTTEEIRRADIIGQVGSNEFVIFFKDIGSLQEFELRLQQILLNVDKKRTLDILFKVGISLVRQGQSYNIAYRQASIALHVSINKLDDIYNFYQDRANEEPFVKQQQIYQNVDRTKFKNDNLYNYTNIHTNDFNDFVGEHGDMAYLIDPETYDLLYANEAFYNRIGKVESECMQMKCYEAVHKRSTPCPFCGKANWSTDKYYIYRNYNEALEQEFLVKNRLVNWQGSRVVLALAIDISNDKSIVDSIDNGTTENSYILSGIEHMQESRNLEECAKSALENIGQFFRADTVRYWQFDNTTSKYQCNYYWTSKTQKEVANFTKGEVKNIEEWLINRKWENEFTVNSQEEMLVESYEIYQVMVNHSITNQRWIPIDDSGILSVISIDNVTINFSNVSFMQSFIGFIVSEFMKRDMIDNIIYRNDHDRLTNLLNRNSYEKYMLDYHGDNVESVAVVVSNINGLKEINSGGGFDLGNHYLIQLGKMMQSIFGKETVYRLSGDDYIVVLTNIDKAYIEEKVKVLQERIAELHSFTVSFGYSWDNIEKDLPKVIEFATQTMIANKKRYYDTVKHNRDTNRLQALNQLIETLENQQFVIFLQAKYDNQLDKVVGAEALIRYVDKEYGVLSPSKYIDRLEKLKLIRYIDIYVFEETCKILQTWQNQGKELPTISLNFSRMTLAEQDLLENLETIFNQYSIPKRKLEIEITESYEDVGKTLIYQNARKLHEAGYAISLDDFGTKYTNLTILSDIAVDILKIDKSLIHSLVNSQRKQLILKNIISMCKDLKITVIAEGVETKEQEEILKQLDCHLIQGYLYSKPIPVSDFEEKYVNRK